jgi:hypothetical protein
MARPIASWAPDLDRSHFSLDRMGSSPSPTRPISFPFLPFV